MAAWGGRDHGRNLEGPTDQDAFSFREVEGRMGRGALQVCSGGRLDTAWQWLMDIRDESRLFLCDGLFRPAFPTEISLMRLFHTHVPTMRKGGGCGIS